jgi:CBS domain-containing protein
MKVREVMTANVEMINSDARLPEAAKRMADADIGLLPVGENDRLVGMVTDRDITIRAVAQGRNPSRTKVRDVMTERVLYCYDDEDVEHIADSIAKLQVRRLPVVNRGKQLVGVISLADIALKHDMEEAGLALGGICMPNGQAAEKKLA